MIGRGNERKLSEFPCPTCAFRQGSFCGAVAERGMSDVRLGIDAPWKAHEGAPPNRAIYKQGTANSDIYVLCQGWAARVLQSVQGGRQILSIILPGEIFSVAQVFSQALHFSVVSLTEARFTRFRRDIVRQMVASDGHLLENLGRHAVAELEAKDLLAVDLGRRRAEERIASLILRLLDRLSAHDALPRDSHSFPLRQQHIADATGLTPVHVSRVISEFRKAGILDLSNGRLTVFDRERLEALGRQA